MRHVLMGFLGVLLLAGVCWATEQAEMKTETQKVNYSVGYQIGTDFRNQEVQLDAEALVEGIRDGIGAVQPKMTDQQMHDTLVELKKRIVALEREKQKAQAEKYRAEGQAFLEANAKQEGVVTLPNGLQYRVLQEGSGQKPTVDDTVKVAYQAALVDNGAFKMPEGNQTPATVAVANAILGWKKALPLMQEGAKWRLFVPPDLAFGHQGPMADRTVVYDIELLKVNPPPEEKQ